MGILSGFIWNIQNICVIGAIPRIGYGIAFPVAQCAIFVGGSWGIWLFNEIKGLAIHRLYLFYIAFKFYRGRFEELSITRVFRQSFRQVLVRLRGTILKKSL